MPEILAKFASEKNALAATQSCVSNWKDIEQCIDADWTIHIPRDSDFTCKKTPKSYSVPRIKTHNYAAIGREAYLSIWEKKMNLGS